MSKMNERSIIVILIVATIIIILGGVLIICCFPPAYCEAIGTVIGGIGGIIAVIWFYASLYFQRQQLEDQKQQFMLEFKQIREDSRRSALALSRDILSETEKIIFKQNSELRNISDLSRLYLSQFLEIKSIMEETNLNEVRQHIDKWLKIEGPAVTLMKGLKSAAEIYFKAFFDDLTKIDFSKEPDEFVYIYGTYLWKNPFFDIYQAPATLLAEFMIRLEPGRKTVILTSMVVASMMAPKGVMKDDKIKQEIEEHKQKNYPIPKIVEIYLEGQ